MAPDPRDPVDVSSWEVVDDETVGAEVKLWLQDQGQRRWLFKSVTEKNGNRQGEDWAEVLSAELAGSLGIPCAEARLATCGGTHGSISLNVRPDGYEMYAGYLALTAADIHGYIPGTRGRVAQKAGRPGHNLRNIRRVLEGLGQPPQSVLPGSLSAFDVFCGYLILDAWIANRDRHDENWSILRPPAGGGPDRLCATYDLAGSMGYNLPDFRREALLRGQSGGVEAWARKGTAWRFEYDPAGKPVTLVELAAEALELASGPGRAHWRGVIAGGGLTVPSGTLPLPTMSVVASNFASSLLETNAERLRHECLARA